MSRNTLLGNLEDDVYYDNTLNLEQNINSIVHKTGDNYVLTNAKLDTLLKRISKNFYSGLAESIAIETLQIWAKHHDRKLVHSFLLIACDVELRWREKYPENVFFRTLTNPHSFDKVLFSDLGTLRPYEQKTLKAKLKNLDYRTETLRTPYWRCVRQETLIQRGNACEACGATGITLDVHHYNGYNFLGEDHLHILDSLMVLCRECHNLHHK